MDIRAGRAVRAAMVMSAFAVLVSAQGMAGQSGGSVLRLAVAGSESEAVAGSVRAFADRVAQLSGDRVRIEVRFLSDGIQVPAQDAAAVTTILGGDADLVLVDTRAWDAAGVRGFRAFDVPGLIEDEVVAQLVASSPVARTALDALSAVGVTGLALWPTGVRHPVALGDHVPFTEAAAFQGATLALVPTEVTTALADALGATLAQAPEPVTAWTGVIDGAEWGFSAGTPPDGAVAVANVALSPGFEVLAARTSVIEALPAEVRGTLARAAGEVVPAAVDDRILAAQWCQAGGRVVHASPEGITSLAMAFQPVVASVLADPADAAVVDRIVSYRRGLPVVPTAEACEPS